LVLERANQRVREEQAATEQARAMMEQHLDLVAHDLRTPLSSLALRLESLTAAGVDDARLSGALQDVTYLALLVGNLHQATRLQRESGRAVVTDLTDVLERVVARFRVVGRHAGVEVLSNRPVGRTGVICDPDGAEQAFSNVISNAIGHRKARAGHVGVTLDDDLGCFCLRVIDDGDALVPHQIPALRDIVARQRREGARVGEGLGLAIVAAVVERNGWTISFQPAEPQGLIVMITGPLAAASEGGPGGLV